MGFEREITEGIGRQIRVVSLNVKFLDMIVDMHTFFCQMTLKEPTKMIMGEKQRKQLVADLDDMHMIMSPWRSPVMLLGMQVIFDGDDRLEVTC